MSKALERIKVVDKIEADDLICGELSVVIARLSEIRELTKDADEVILRHEFVSYSTYEVWIEVTRLETEEEYRLRCKEHQEKLQKQLDRELKAKKKAEEARESKIKELEDELNKLKGLTDV